MIHNGDTWALREYAFAHNGETKIAFVLNTPIEIHDEGVPPRRATTSDNYRFFAAQAELGKNPDTSMVAATTSLYTPGQHLSAMRELTLPYGAHVETVGRSAEHSSTKRLPTRLLQEAKAGIDAAVKLQDAISGVSRSREQMSA